jgi:sulfur-carrier protein
MPQVTILFFGSIGELFGAQRQIEIPPDCSVGDLRRILAEEHDAIAAPTIRAAVGQQVAEEDTPIDPGDEVAFFSPVSGG